MIINCTNLLLTSLQKYKGNKTSPTKLVGSILSIFINTADRALATLKNSSVISGVEYIVR